MKRYQNVEFKKKYSIELLKQFFKEFPEEKRGRKKFKDKEIQNAKHLIYENIFQNSGKHMTKHTKHMTRKTYNLKT